MKKLDNLGVSAFCESMGMMVRAGIQTDEAISLLEQGTSSKEKGVLGTGISVMKQKVDENASLSEAMRASGIFPEYALQMMEAGETSGRQEDVLFRLSRYYKDQKTISEKLRSAVTYPAAMIVLIIAVLAVMLAMVLPTFTEVYDSLTGSLSASTYGYIRWAYGFCWFALILMVILAVCLFGGFWMWNNGKKSTVEKVLRRIPCVRRSWIIWECSALLLRWACSWPAAKCRILQSWTVFP